MTFAAGRYSLGPGITGVPMFRRSIKQKIVCIAAGLIVLAVITSLLSMVMAARVGHSRAKVGRGAA
jgi:hypothetical protein